MLTTRPKVAENRNFKYLALGDSYTIGTSVNLPDRWPLQLARKLANEGITLYEQQIIATNGWTTAELSTSIAGETPASNFDLVSLLIGVNNQYRGQSLATYEREFDALVRRAISFAAGKANRVFIVSIPDYAYTPEGQNKAGASEGVARFNASARTIADRHDVLFLDITSISQEGLADPSLVATDGLHPSGKQYARWVDEVLLDGAKQLLSKG